jgi:nucleotide-binding universal stress UspA family protein
VFRHVLLPVDLSDRSHSAVAAAAELAEPGSVVVLLHVIETLSDVPFHDLSGFYGDLEKRAEQVLQKWAAELDERGFSVRREIVFGKRAPEIVRYATDESCDLVVVTSHRIDPERPTGSLGTISHQVALVAPCPVLLVR